MRSGGSTTSWWTQLPRGRVVHLTGVDADALTVALDPLPVEAPAVITYRPGTTRTQAAIVGEVLELLERSAVELFPAWLPGWDLASGRGGANVAAARVLALRLASRTDHFGPFLADLAARALTGRRPASSFPPESQASGLTKALTTSYDRSDVVLLIDVPDDLPSRNEQILVGAAEWLAAKGDLGGVWLVGASLTSVDWIASQRVALPTDVADLIANAPALPAGVRPPGAPGSTTATLGLPPLAGKPAPNSPAEQLLEKALAAAPWTRGRVWNQSFSLGVLTRPIRVDLLWEAERTAVEVDGPEHWQRVHYADDRARDVLLQAAGYAVLRFTNDQVLGDVVAVVHQLEQFITARRVPGRPEGHPHVG